MNELQDMTPEELEAILGTDYETVIADALRRKQASEGSGAPDRAAGQMANGHVYFDPGYAIEKGMNRYRMGKEAKAAQGDLDKALADQKNTRRTMANVALRPQGPAPVPTAAQDPMAGPPKPPMPPQGAAPAQGPPTMGGPPPPSAGASPMGAPPPPPSPQAGLGPTAGPLGPVPAGEPLRGPPRPGAARPPLANAATMDPAALQGAGVPLDVQELLRQLRGR